MSSAARPTSRLLALAAVAALCLLTATTAAARDRIYWINEGDGSISFSNLDGSGGGTIATGGLPTEFASAISVDPHSQRIMWTTVNDDGIFFASLLGAGTGRQEIGAVVAKRPNGLAVDSARGRFYWSSFDAPPGIFFGELDGSLAGLQEPADGDLGTPGLLVLDAAAGRIYWAGRSNRPLGFTDLAGGGGTVPNSIPPTGVVRESLILDHGTGRFYWSYSIAKTIGFTALDGSGSGSLNTTGATITTPKGSAIDPQTGRIYWANSTSGNGISFARLDGSGGGDLQTPGAKPADPSQVLIYAEPRSTAAPEVVGGNRIGSELSCAVGGWAADWPESRYYTAPHDFAFEWSRDDVELRGAGGATVVATAPGDYQCRVTATNVAGQASRSSRSHAVLRSAFGKSAGLTLKLGSRRPTAKGALLIRVANSNPFPVSGRLAVGLPAMGGKKGAAGGTAAKALKVGAGGKAAVRLTLPRALRAQLGAKGRLRLALTATVRDLDGNRRTLVKSAVVRAGHG